MPIGPPNKMLKGNLSKYQTMTLKHNCTESNIPLHFRRNTIETSECLNLLGVTIDELNFNTHINEIIIIIIIIIMGNL